jgi:colanic acid biosynthesis glycosyl transferase WcaI
MKILLMTPFFPPEVGSAAHLYYELAQALQSRGHQVTVVTGLPRYHVVNGNGSSRHLPIIRERYHGLRVWRVFNLDIPWNHTMMRGVDQFISAFSAGLTLLGMPSFDLAMVYSPPLPLALAALMFCKIRKKPLVANVQDLFPQSAIDLGLLNDPLLIKVFRNLESTLYRRADLITVHSSGNRDYILERGGDSRFVREVPNWVDTNAIRPSSRCNGVRGQLGLNNHFVVSFAGIMGYAQDLETVLGSANLLRDCREVVFLLVGDGVERERLMTIARSYSLDNVIFLPMQSREKYPEILAASDICLATLRKEVLTPVVPSKILNIMASGRPLLACLPPSGDAPRLVDRAQCGLSLKPEDPIALAEAILRLYREPSLSASMGRQGRQYAVQHFSLKSCVVRLEDLFKEVLTQSHL